MDSHTINQIAESYAKAIELFPGLEEGQKVELALRIVHVVALGSRPIAQVPHNPTPEPVRTTNADNPGEGPTLAHKGEIKSCVQCKRQVYKLGADIRGVGMGINSILKAFVPITDDIRELTRDDWEVFTDKDNCIYIDCPSCQGKKTLQITGLPKTEEEQVKAQDKFGVGSMDGGSL